MADQNRKTMRTFYCRDYLWDLFEMMAEDMGCSVDYLINESMRHFARQQNYLQPSAPAPAPIPPPQAAPMPPPAPKPAPAPAPPPRPPRRAPAASAPHARGGYYPQPGSPPQLFLIFNGMKYPVDKDRYIIGREIGRAHV